MYLFVFLQHFLNVFDRKSDVLGNELCEVGHFTLLCVCRFEIVILHFFWVNCCDHNAIAGSHNVEEWIVTFFTDLAEE